MSIFSIGIVCFTRFPYIFGQCFPLRKIFKKMLAFSVVLCYNDFYEKQ